MKLGILNGIGGKVIGIDIARIKAAESMGYDSVWTAEAYGSDAVTPAAWILAQTDRSRLVRRLCKCRVDHPHVRR